MQLAEEPYALAAWQGWSGSQAVDLSRTIPICDVGSGTPSDSELVESVVRGDAVGRQISFQARPESCRRRSPVSFGLLRWTSDCRVAGGFSIVYFEPR